LLANVAAEIYGLFLVAPLSSVQRGIETSQKYDRVAIIAFRQQEEAPKAERE
jgi:hypothetical protein